MRPHRAWARWLGTERALAPGTVRSYGREVAKLKRAQRATTAQLRAHLAGADGTPATAARRLAAFRSFYGFLLSTGVRADDPSALISSPKVRHGIPRPVQDVEERIATLNPEAHAIAVLLLETGLRISEACALDCAVPAPDEIVVRGKGAKERLLPLTDQARATLDALGGRVPVSVRTIQRRFRAAGFTPHALRHTFATELISSGADLGDVQTLLGHASPQTTRIYADYGTARLRRALERRKRR